MDKKETMLVFSVLLLAYCLFMTVLHVNVAHANPIASAPPVPSIQISYPLTSIGGYVNSTVEFEVYVNTFIDSPALYNISYCLDNGMLVTLEDLKVDSHYDFGPERIDFKTYTVNVILNELSEGNHRLVAYANGMSAGRGFIVNSHYGVALLTVQCPTGVAYAGAVPLVFSINGEIVNAHYYLYRGRESVFDRPLSGNTTLGNLSAGSYSMYLFVTTEYGQSSASIPFSVVDESLFVGLTIIVGAMALLLLSIAVIFLVYLKTRKRPNIGVSQESLTNPLSRNVDRNP